ncbi:unnamed protein product (macronuclear) [Paramecium tetraurelia]|uniref:Protein kinase domain-containing protein n=1 Tax=Paramecium tetraurelia TaxID=5888 RepID=A0C2C6_PARTE|nr:uncharacterized protein GSPATT00034420001 [Paramecium tetraurelia]CAK64943.1 unnamed protein product [Paramecium tetraurelia]|eukprot:XP_001432340.1 hypothetical protein (macronuclear) [Paramecium tetraurelia strain d4-2]
MVCRGIIGQQVGTPFYIAPEVINGGEQTQAIDIFSLGIIYYLMMCKNKHPNWQDGVKKKEYCKIISQEFSITYPYHLSEMAQDFVRNAVCHNPFDRITAEQCLEHPWMLGERSKSQPNYQQRDQIEIFVYPEILNYHQCVEYYQIYKRQMLGRNNQMKLTKQCQINKFPLLLVFKQKHISLNRHRIQNLKKSFALTKTSSHQDFTTMKNRQLNKFNTQNRYQTQLDLHLSIPKVNSQKKIHVHLPSISPQQTKQSKFRFKQS